MNGSWIKIVLLLLLILMVTGIVSALLDPGLGDPDDSRRTRHPAGFSISYPLGWGGTSIGYGEAGTPNSIRVAPERKTGRETSINVVYSDLQPESVPNAKRGTFQEQPAFYSSRRLSRDWQWRVQFQRDSKWYEILLVSPIELDVEKSAYWPYIESFRIEKPILTATTSPVPAVVPAR